MGVSYDHLLLALDHTLVNRVKIPDKGVMNSKLKKKSKFDLPQGVSFVLTPVTFQIFLIF